MPLLFLSETLFIFCLGCFIVVMLLRIWDSLMVPVPFVPVRIHVLGDIVDMLALTPGSKLYDLGCGDARVLLSAYNRNAEISGVGIEKGILPYLISRIRTHKKPIRIIYGDMLSENLSSATHIYCYLSDASMKALEPKLIRECAPGTRVVSCDFPLPGYTPSEVRQIQNGHNPLARTLYLYIL